ncbi:MAG: hypothetical protein FJY10_10770 [Bacteroidetes bacterium]|nr:hypothetical protein [Bacteroidota bacterium]
MKRIIFSLLVSFVFINALSAQDEESTKIQLSLLGAPMIEFSGIEKEFAVSSGGGGALVFNQTFLLGGYGLGLLTDHRTSLTLVENQLDTIVYNDLKTSLTSGGFWVGYQEKSERFLDWGVTAKLGWGNLNLKDKEGNAGKIVSDNVFLIEPQLEFIFKFTKWFHLNLGIGYRFVSGIDKEYINVDKEEVKYFKPDRYNSAIGTLSLVFGRFN